MTHVEHGQLQAYLDGEVDARTSVDIENHLKSCVSCLAERKALESAAQVFATAMRGVDIAAPARPVIAAAARKPAGLWLSRGALSRAAIMVLGVAALASAAIPGSPVRKWLAEKFSGDVARQTAASSSDAPAEPAIIPTTPA